MFNLFSTSSSRDKRPKKYPNFIQILVNGTQIDKVRTQIRLHRIIMKKMFLMILKADVSF